MKQYETTRRTALDIIRSTLGVVGASIAFPAAFATSASELFPALYPDPKIFLDAISRERIDLARPVPVTGITVPHHLLAADLIARGFWAAQGNKFARVIILSPIHFNRGGRRLATTCRGFRTAFGPLQNDIPGTRSLIENSALFEDTDVFDKEHGVHAVLPFVKWFFGDAKIIPIAIPSRSSRPEWDAAVREISKLVNQSTLVIQSTDFSHYLRPELAIQRDQETLNLIAAGDRETVARLVQPDHMDSKGSQYIQMSLQADLKSTAVVVANRNSAEYFPDAQKTTSYIVQVYTKDRASAVPVSYSDQQVFYFCGDAFLGRWMTQYLMNQAVSEQIISCIRGATGGAPLIVNLEGALLDEPPGRLPTDVHAMHASLAIPILKALNVRAACLANNHAFDLGDIGLSESRRILAESGITPLLHGECTDLGPFRVLPINFVGGVSRNGYPLAQKEELEEAFCSVEGKPPVFALVHWGREYTTKAQTAEYDIAASLYNCGVSAVIGAHSHQAAETIEARNGGEYQLCFSLGNFLFDQHAPRGSATLLEVRVFEQRTFATRLVPLPNLFDLARSIALSRDVQS